MPQKRVRRRKHCGVCGKPGHTKRSCPTNPEGVCKGAGTVTCSLCGQKGHNNRCCPVHPRCTTVVCSICGKDGHNCRTCWLRSGGERPQSTSASTEDEPDGTGSSAGALPEDPAAVQNTACTLPGSPSSRGANTAGDPSVGDHEATTAHLNGSATKAEGKRARDNSDQNPSQLLEERNGNGATQSTEPHPKALRTSGLVGMGSTGTNGRSPASRVSLKGSGGQHSIDVKHSAHDLLNASKRVGSFDKALALAKDAVMRAWTVKERHVTVEWKLPSFKGQCSTAKAEVQKQFSVAMKLAELLLVELCENSSIRGPLRSQLYTEADPVGEWQGENVAALVFPTSAYASRLKQLMDDGPEDRLIICINPRWQLDDTPGQHALSPRAEQLRPLLQSFLPVYVCTELQVYGDCVNIVRMYPEGWSIYWKRAGDELKQLEVDRSRPSFDRIAQLLCHEPDSQTCASWLDRLRVFTAGQQPSNGACSSSTTALPAAAPMHSCTKPPENPGGPSHADVHISEIVTPVGSLSGQPCGTRVVGHGHPSPGLLPGAPGPAMAGSLMNRLGGEAGHQLPLLSSMLQAQQLHKHTSQQYLPITTEPSRLASAGHFDGLTVASPGSIAATASHQTRVSGSSYFSTGKPEVSRQQLMSDSSGTMELSVDLECTHRSQKPWLETKPSGTDLMVALQRLTEDDEGECSMTGGERGLARMASVMSRRHSDGRHIA